MEAWGSELDRHGSRAEAELMLRPRLWAPEEEAWTTVTNTAAHLQAARRAGETVTTCGDRCQLELLWRSLCNIYTIESLCRIPETNVTLCQPRLNKKKKKEASLLKGLIAEA